MGSRVDHSLSLLLFWDWPRFDFAGIVVQMGTPEGCLGSGGSASSFFISEAGLRWFVTSEGSPVFFSMVLAPTRYKQVVWRTMLGRLLKILLVGPTGLLAFSLRPIWSCLIHTPVRLLGVASGVASRDYLMRCRVLGLWLLTLRGKPNKLNDGAWREVETL